MKVLLTALSAKHIHKTLAPWCLKAYCDVHVSACDVIVQEHTINDNIGDIVAAIFEEKPDVVGFSCYIWNIERVGKVAAMLRKCLPACVIVLGGPEVSFEADYGAYPFADYVIQGPGEVAFAHLIRTLSHRNRPENRLIHAPKTPDLDDLPSPYTDAYFRSFEEGRMRSIANQLVYYESSRGCPFSCTYCLSSTFCGVDELALERVFADIATLLSQGATCIKFVDRTFNANRRRTVALLTHIRALETDCTFHFEVAADLFDSELLALIATMPPGRVQFEIGIQSLHPATLAEIDRRMDAERALQNIRTLTSFGNCHVHVDLIAGLPFDTVESFAMGVDACIAVRPHMLQLGFLKMLRGTEIRNASAAHGYVYNEFAPYEISRNDYMSFEDIVRLKRVEAVVDRFYNSGVFAQSVRYAVEQVFGGAFAFFDAFAVFCKGEPQNLSPKHAYTLLYRFLCAHIDPALAAHWIKLDCLTFSSKNVLPDGIAVYRDKEAEHGFRRSVQPYYSDVRVEFFEYDGQTRGFVYDARSGIDQSYQVVVL